MHIRITMSISQSKRKSHLLEIVNRRRQIEIEAHKNLPLDHGEACAIMQCRPARHVVQNDLKIQHFLGDANIDSRDVVEFIVEIEKRVLALKKERINVNVTPLQAGALAVYTIGKRCRSKSNREILPARAQQVKS